MSGLDWEKFRRLPGDPTKNWEDLCRATVFRSFGSAGVMRSVSQQPGVEFHLEIKRSSTVLGTPPRWWAWQCRWYDVQPGRQIGNRRRSAIEESIRKTEELIPEITDWVLWTRRPLTPADQIWFYDIHTSMELHMWTADSLEDLMVGDVEILREAYFGELVLTPESLRSFRDSALTSVSNRWNPAVHVENDVECEIRRVLGDAQYWPDVASYRDDLSAAIDKLTQSRTAVDEEWSADLRLLDERLVGVARVLG